MKNIRKAIILLLFFLPFFYPDAINAATYYVTNSGNDSCNGLSQNIGSSGTCAWQSISKVNSSSFLPGDSVLFKKGDIWREQLNIPSSGSSGSPIIFSSYGSGDKPKIYGSTLASTWTSENYSIPLSITKVQGPPVIGIGSTSVTTTFSSTPTQNNLIVVLLGCTGSSTGVGGVALTGFTLSTSATVGTSNGFVSTWYKIAGASESTGISATISGGSSCNIIAEEWTNINTSNPLDRTAFTNDTGSTVSSRSSGTTSTTSTSNSLAFTGHITGNTTTSRSWSNSFNAEYQNDLYYIYAASRVLSATGTYESTMSWTTARRAGGTISIFNGSQSSSVQLYHTTSSSDPGYVWFLDNGDITLGNKVNSKDELNSEYDWWFDDPNNRVYIYSTSDPLTAYSSIEMANMSQERGIFWTGSGNSYIDVDGFEVAFIAGAAIVSRGNEWSITNNHVHHLGDSVPTGHSYGIELQTTTNSTVSNNVVHDTLRACSYLVTSYTPYINTDNIIELNTFYDCQHSLILARTESQHGSNTLSGSIIRYNNLYHSEDYSPISGDGFGINIYGTSGYLLDDFQIYYNTVFVKRAGIQLSGYVSNTDLSNNSIISSLGKGISVEGLGNSNISVVNNLVAGAGLYGYYVPDSSQILSSNYNLFYAPSGTSYANIDSTNYGSTGFDSYKTATGWDENSFWQNPLIVSSSTPDFHLSQSSVAINSGYDLDLTRDIAGTSIPLESIPEIGTYEFIPLTVTINQKNDQSDPSSSDSIYFDVLFSEDVTGFADDDLAITGTSGATTVDISGSGDSYVVAVSGMTQAGTVILSLPQSKVTGNTSSYANRESTSTDNTVTYSRQSEETSTPTPQPTSTSSSGIDNTCYLNVSSKAPWLFGGSPNYHSVEINFIDYSGSEDSYVLEYGTESGKYIYSSSFSDQTNNASKYYIVNHMAPNTDYYFRIKAVNGCAFGPWSNEIKVTTNSLFDLEPKLIATSTNTTSNSQTEEILKANDNDNEYTLTLKLKGKDNLPLSNVKVILHSEPKEGVTDKNGVITFNNVEKGNHELYVYDNKYTGKQSISVGGESKSIDISITLERKDNTKNLLLYSIPVLILIAVFLLKRKGSAVK